MHSGNVIRADGSRPKAYNSFALLEGRLLAIVRAAWLLVAVLSLGIYVAALPYHYRQLLGVCVGNECHLMQLAPPEVTALERLGFSPAHYAAYHIMLSLILALAYASVALVIFVRQSRERMALISAMWLITFGPTAFSAQALGASEPQLNPLVTFTDQLGWILLLPLFLLTFQDGRFVPRWTRP